MRTKHLLFSFFALAILAVGCTKPEEEKTVTVNPAPTSLNVPAEGGKFTVNLVATAAWKSSADTWISVSPSSGQGSSNAVTIEISVGANTAKQAREGSVKFTATGVSATVKVSQSAASGPDNPGGDEFSGTIATAADLVKFLEVASTIVSGTEVPVTADIDVAGAALPVAEEFNGILNGQNHAIKGIKSSTSLFLVNNGTVKNLTFEGEYAGDAVADNLFLSPVANINNGTIEKVTNKASIKATGANAGSGVIIGGIVCESYGSIVDCTNEGAISYDAGDGVYGAAVGGIVGLLGGSAKGCTNKGAVSLKAHYIAGRSAMGQIDMNYPISPVIAGIAAYAVGDDSHVVSVDECNNSGKITYYLDQIEKIAFTDAEGQPNSGSPGRISICGIVGSTGGDITNCNNSGDIDVTAISSTRETVVNGSNTENRNLIIHPAGIAGAEYFVKAPRMQDMTNVINCHNTGNITLDLDASNSNSTVGGIFAWPGLEGVQVSVVQNCTSSGNITISGANKVRVGGVTGGTGNLLGCKFSGNITVNSTLESSVFGMLIGFSTQGHRIEDCETSGSITSKVKVKGLSGFIGGAGNSANSTAIRCKVNANVQGTDDTVDKGLVVGMWNGKKAIVTYGSLDSPILVKGKMNGTDITVDNFRNYLFGASSYNSDVHTVFAAFDDGTPGGSTGDTETVSINPSKFSFTSDGGSREIAITSSSAWTASCQASWLKAVPAAGDKGSSTMVVTAEPNTGDAREAEITVTAGSATATITVSQSAPATGLTVAHWSFKDPSVLTENVDYGITYPDIFVMGDDGVSKMALVRGPDSQVAPSKVTYLDNGGYVRLLSESLWLDDAWVFSAPVDALPAGTYTISYTAQSSAKGPKFFIIEYSTDGANWTAVNAKTTNESYEPNTEVFVAHDVTYTYAIDYAPGTAANSVNFIQESFHVPAISAGTFYVRARVCDRMTQDRTRNLGGATGDNRTHSGTNRLGKEAIIAFVAD